MLILVMVIYLDLIFAIKIKEISMKVLVIKCYLSKYDVLSNYGDDYVEIWHNLNVIEDVKDVTAEELDVLNRAVAFFNSRKKNPSYSLKVVSVPEEEEVNCLVSDLLAFEKSERERIEKENAENAAKAINAKKISEAKKKANALKKLAKELNLSESEIEMLKDKSK